MKKKNGGSLGNKNVPLAPPPPQQMDIYLIMFIHKIVVSPPPAFVFLFSFSCHHRGWSCRGTLPQPHNINEEKKIRGNLGNKNVSEYPPPPPTLSGRKKIRAEGWRGIKALPLPPQKKKIEREIYIYIYIHIGDESRSRGRSLVDSSPIYHTKHEEPILDL